MSNVDKPGALLGYKKNGEPFYLIAGGSENAPEGQPAGDPTPTPTPQPQLQPYGQPQSTPGMYSQEDLQKAIEKARQEEKDKLYGRINKTEEETKTLREQMASIQQQREEAETKAREEQERMAAEAKAKAEEEMSAKQLLDEREKEWNARFEQMQKEQAERDAVSQKEREYLELQNYTRERVSQESDNIAPELVNYITENSKEEIEASIAKAVETTNAIFENVQAAQTQQRSQQPGVSPAGYAPTGPMDNNSVQQSLSAEDIQNMSIEDYAKLRNKMGIGNSQNNRGIFG